MSSTHHAFGDESAGPTHVVYSVFSMPAEAQLAIEEKIAEIKTAFGGSGGDRLHCRELFHNREKTAWARLNIDGVFDLYTALARAINQPPYRRIVSFARKADFPKDFVLGPMGGEEAMPPAANLKNYLVRDKELAAICAHGALFPLQETPGWKNVCFWPDEDRSKIQWFRDSHQASRAASFLVMVGADGKEERVQLMPSESPKPVLVDVADFIAYVSQRTLLKGSSPNDRRFAALYKAMGPERIRYSLAPDGALRFQVLDALRR